MRRLIAVLSIILSLSACALGNELASEIKLTVIPMEETEEAFGNIIESTAEIEASPTVTQIPATTVPQPSPTPSPATVRNTSNCTIRTDLPIYIVLSGDTLSSIAARYNTTAAQLSEYNCLSDANLISVGMSLRVPIQPTPSYTPTPTAIWTLTPTPTLTFLGTRGTLGVYPAIEAGNPSDWNDYVIEPQSTITISWTGIEPEYYADIVGASFFFLPDNGRPDQIAVDNDMSDGIAATWTVPAGVSGQITGYASTAANGYYQSSTLHVREPENDNPQ